jgi:hypothetical protein
MINDTWVLTYKPERGRWPDFNEDRRKIALRGKVSDSYPFLSYRRAGPGDDVYLLCQGKYAGPIGHGWVVGRQERDPRWFWVEFDFLCEPEHALITRKELNRIWPKLGRIPTLPVASGQEPMPQEAAARLAKLWAQRVRHVLDAMCA